MPTILGAFVTFPTEAAIIGRLLAGYTSLELSLFHCVHMGIGDFDTALKAMFRTRGETARILKAEKIGEAAYDALKLGRPFRAAIGSLRFCLKIRSRYAHSAWWDDNSGKLALANIEDVALLPIKVIDLHHLPTSHVDVALLEQQEAYYAYVDRLLLWINYEGRLKAGKLPSRVYPKPAQMRQPPLQLP